MAMDRQGRLITLQMLFLFLLFSPQLILAAEDRSDVLQQAITLSGTVIDAATGQGLPGANLVVSGRVTGTATRPDGSFSLSVSGTPPITIIVSLVGYQSREIDITSTTNEGMVIELQERTLLGSDVVVSASRVEESFMEAPVTIEKMDVIAISQTPSESYYRALANLKGVDMTASSINFQIINARGFNSTGNTRMVQLIDGMDTQAPALNFPIGNLNGPSELDIESVEFLPGAASALYGPNAFSGILLITSKSPFDYPGLSVTARSGMNHLGGDKSLGEYGSPRAMFDTAVRYADRLSDRFAFKVNFAFSRADDWMGVNFRDKNAAADFTGNSGMNPAYDGVHLYGDDGSFNIGLLGINETTRQTLAAILVQQFQGALSQQDAEQYVASLPAQPVNRTGYEERYLADYDARNVRASTSLHYRVGENAELSYAFNYGSGTSIYTGAQRYSLKNFHISQHKVELRGDNYVVRGYGTFENSGDSYIADFVGYSINEAYRDSETWFGTYGAGFTGGVIQAAMAAQGGDTSYNPAVVQAILSDPALVSQFHTGARGLADQGRYLPGTPEFEEARDAALQSTIPAGALFDDNSRFLHSEGMYDFKNEIDFIDLQVGASFRQFQLRSNETVFDDAGGLQINEWGGFVQASRQLLDPLRVSASVRYDKNENFDGQFSPRLSAVLSVADGHHLRGSYQTGFRNPSTQGQYIDLNVITAQLIGGLPYLAERYQITNNAWTMESVGAFTDQFLADPGNPAAAAALLVPYTEHRSVQPEQIKSFEIGYKGLFDNRLLIDAAWYYSIFDDFITQIRVRRAAAPINTAEGLASLLSGNFQNTFQVYTNVDNTVRAQGAVFGAEYSLPRSYRVGFNYNWNRLVDSLEDQFINDFNTPEHKVNLSFGNRRLTDRLGFNLVYRWQEAFRWESTFVREDVDAVSTLDAQLSYRIPDMRTVVKLGGTNLFNNRHSLSGGGPSIGSILYLSVTYDQLFR